MSEKLEQLKSAILSGQVPQLVLNTISFALDERASDIHIEPDETNVRIRYRIDGVLRLVVEYPTNMHPAVVSRIKIMSNLKIDEQRIPQDGRSQVTTKDGREMDLRISTLPTVNGEKVVMRIQDKSRNIPSLEELGLRGNSLKFLKAGLEDPNGVILTSGPTGSGKTTTLYSCLTILNKPDVNILTIEDPVEIQMSGLSQSQVHADIEYNFATGLRAALRQDPDIIMVGEIRDRETIDVAIEAALTGHLVLSTIHTNSATETLTRIHNMGVQPFLMSSTVNTIIAQRLVRKLCQHCRQPVSISQLQQEKPELTENILKAYKNIHESELAHYPELGKELTTVYRAQGCDKCEGAGYFGRLGLYEVMDINNRIREAIILEKSTIEIEEIARDQGMVSLEQAGLIKVALGETSVEEVYRVARSNSVETNQDPAATVPDNNQQPTAEPATPAPQPQPNPEPQITEAPVAPPQPPAAVEATPQPIEQPAPAVEVPTQQAPQPVQPTTLGISQPEVAAPPAPPQPQPPTPPANPDSTFNLDQQV